MRYLIYKLKQTIQERGRGRKEKERRRKKKSTFLDSNIKLNTRIRIYSDVIFGRVSRAMEIQGN